MPILGSFGAGSAKGLGLTASSPVEYSIDILLVAGGGGGGNSKGAGGGGGGMRKITGETFFSNETLTVTVGS
jgi:hypothetical protein